MNQPNIPSAELPIIAAHPRRTIDSYLIDTDFSNDIRNAMISLDLSDDNAILAECESDRTLDLRRCLHALRTMRRAELTELALDHSLCPLHFIDFAICFDDADPECAAIRTIYPDTHDT
jgi:hypothetical protein